MTFADSTEQQTRDIQALRNNGITEFQIENTSRCNFRCRMCDRKGSGRDMDDNLVKLIIARFPAIQSLGINGLGEPFLSSNILEFVNAARQAGTYVHMPTNGLCLTKDLVDVLIRAEVDAVNISMDGATASAFEAIHGVDAFGKVLNNTRMFVTRRNRSAREKPRLSFCVVMMRQNLEQFPDIVRLGAELGLARMSFINLTLCGEDHLDQILFWQSQELW